ncbi:hypothetical protein IWX78_002343 [Mycetocola sp. CAN_C7]|uniref:hypothetical protein n=1 Tax=Mycetocola sp. CAN_C7 TaxID=2787724 RepID=UPI0018CB25A5
MPRPRLVILVLACLVTPITLTGCTQIGDGISGGVEQAIEDASGGALDVNLSGGLPEGFPEAEVPLVPGDVMGAATTVNGTAGWVVNVTAQDAGDAASELLTDAGFTETGRASNADGSVLSTTSDSFQVTVVSSPDTVVYTVVPL